MPVLNGQNELVFCRAFLDSGAESSFITEDCLQRLNLKSRKRNITIQGVGGENLAQSNGSVDLTLGQDCDLKVKCAVLTKITNAIPTAYFTMRNWSSLKNVKLADPNFNIPSQIDLLLGADIYDRIVLEAKIQQDSVFLRETTFGWIVSGCIADCQRLNRVRTFHVVVDDFDLSKFWQLEEVPKYQKLSTEEIACEKHFVETTKRLANGRFQVELPFKNETPSNLDFTLSTASRRFTLLEKRFLKNDQLKNDYCAFIKEFVDLGHLEKVPKDELVKIPSHVAYLPHHAVFKQSSTTTKTRVVFDGSAQKQNISLNNSLMVGPKIQDDLFKILLRFRKHKIALSADVTKMYRQIALEKSSKDFHRIVWRWNANDVLEHFRMTRVTYGIASSSFHSIRSLFEAARVISDEIASPIIERDFYVDDLVTGADSVSEGIEMFERIFECLKNSCFEIRKWSSNSMEVLDSIPAPLHETENLRFDKSHAVKELGVQWNPSKDVLFFEAFSIPQQPLTKRLLLSDSSRIFDPLGLLAPVVIKLKCSVQESWRLKLDWDDLLPESLIKTWLIFRESLCDLNILKIPRRILCENFEAAELHIFCDASESAYASVAYIVSKNSDDFLSHLLCSKTRIAPIKTISVPRLELCAALLGSTLCGVILTTLKPILKIDSVFAWSDSTVALSWIKSTPKRWSNFVANRVAKIQDEIPSKNWNHIPSEENPADVATRGQTVSALAKNSLWWKGPTFLMSRDSWPKNTSIFETDLQQRKNSIFHSLKNSAFESIIDFERFSNFFRGYSEPLLMSIDS